MTYLINIPFALFALELLGRGWKASIALWLRLCVAFALIAIPTAFFAHTVYWIGPMNGVIVVGGTEAKQENWCFWMKTACLSVRFQTQPTQTFRFPSRSGTDCFCTLTESPKQNIRLVGIRL